MTEQPSSPRSGDPSGPLRRRRDGRLIAGVAGGLADHLQLDPSLVRVGLVALTLLGGAGIPCYAAAWLLIPEEGAPESMAAALLHRKAL